MTRRTKINFKQKILSIFFVLVSLTSIVGMVGVTAIDVDANEVINKIDNAAKVWMIASTMKRCLSDIDEDERDMDEVKQAEFLDTEDIVVGPWFENLVGAEVDNGKISGCAADEVGGGKSMPQIFARYILGDEGKYMSEIVCGNRDVFNPVTKGSGVTVENCMEAEAFDIDPAKVGNVFKKYYDEYVDSQNNGYLVKWDEIGSIPGAFGYRVGYNDYMVGCAPGITGVAIADDNKLSANTVSVNYADGTFGRIDTIKLPTGEKTKKTDYYTVYGRNDSGLKCGEIAFYGISGFANKYSEAIVRNLASFCKRELVPTIDENIANAKEVLRPFYDQQYGNGGWSWEEATHTYFSSIERDKSAKEAWDYLNVWGLSSANALNDWIFINRINRKSVPVGYGIKSDYDTEAINSGWECRGDAGVEIGVIIDEPSEPDETNYEQDACYSASGSLSWIVCPVMQKLGGALDWVYDEMVEPFLKVNKGLLSGSEGTREAWGVVVGFANLAVVIFILIIIFSQLTGVGIDNYGIKKSLPKVVIAAVLINFSFVICQVAVDISNIVGNGLNSTLSDISVGNSYECTPSGGGSGLTLSGDNGSEECVPMSSGSSEQAGMFKTMFNVAAGGLIGVGVVSVVSNVLSTGFLAGFLIPILLLLVTAVIAVLFFFVLLGMRQAGVVILVVLSPLALACYMLPNTKRYYDKWFKAFSGLLLVYPICGLLIGGGQLTSKIILSASTNYMTYFVGCVLMVAPFFLIPSLLKGSFAAMGNIGAKVSGLGKSFGSKGRSSLDRGIKNSNRYQQRVKENQERQALRRANRIKNGVFGVGGLGNRAHLNRRQQRRLMAAGQVIAADQSKTRKAYEEQFAELNGSDLATEADNAGRWIDGPDGDQKMAALITALNKAGKEEKVFELLDAHSGKAAMKSTAVSSALIGSGNFLQTAYGKRKEEKTFSEFKNAASKGLADYIKDNGVKDMDKDSLKHINESGLGGIVSSEMVKNGAISASSPKVRDQFNKMLEGQINNISDLSNLKLTANDLSTMDDTTAKTILNKVKNLPGVADENAAKLAIQNALQTQIASARSNEQAMSKISPDGAVHDVFFSGVPTPTSTSSAPGSTPSTPSTPTAYGGGGGYGTDTSAWD